MILLGLGSNLGEREKNLERALMLLEEDGSIWIDIVSSIYETTPFGVTDQPDFLNMAARVKTGLSPMDLLKKCLTVENEMGRIRTRHWGPRVIDIDLLVYHNIQMNQESLTLPHPGIANRPFVLIPLQDIAGQLALPEGREVAELIVKCNGPGEQGVRLWRKVEWDSLKKCFV